MREILKIDLEKHQIYTKATYEKLFAENKNNELIVYSDNVLEGISLLNSLSKSDDDILTLLGVVYEPIDQPIYIFKDKSKNYYSIKVCGGFGNWDLPQQVFDIENFIDLPDIIIYSVSDQKVIFCAETTETASVGNSQWQREGRKIGAAKFGSPFVYQTFYSGKDESQGTTREPSSLQVLNHLLYSIRYRIPSFVIYLDNNFADTNARIRTGSNGESMLIKYVKLIIVGSLNPSSSDMKQEIERSMLQHMIGYLNEGKTTSTGFSKEPRLISDFPIIEDSVKDTLLDKGKTKVFINNLVNMINNVKQDSESFNKKYPLSTYNFSKGVAWTSYDNKMFVSELIAFLNSKGQKPISYVARAKVGIVQRAALIEFLNLKFPDKTTEIRSRLKTDEILLIPLRLHKKSNGVLTFSPDPESGEIAAFSELLSMDLTGQKNRSVLGYCIVEPPKEFDINRNPSSKLNKSLSKYVDLIVINGSQLVLDVIKQEDQIHVSNPQNLYDLRPLNTTEEVAIVSTFLNMSTIKSSWDLCFIHTHHSSWQQLVLYKNHIVEHQMKINRNKSKVDLVMQEDDELFMIGEGKKKYSDFFASEAEIRKIKAGMDNVQETIISSISTKTRLFFSFICMIDLPLVNQDFFLNKAVLEIRDSVAAGHLEEITLDDYVVISAFRVGNITRFKLFFSKNFDPTIKTKLLQVFEG